MKCFLILLFNFIFYYLGLKYLQKNTTKVNLKNLWDADWKMQPAMRTHRLIVLNLEFVYTDWTN